MGLPEASRRGVEAWGAEFPEGSVGVAWEESWGRLAWEADVGAEVGAVAWGADAGVGADAGAGAGTGGVTTPAGARAAADGGSQTRVCFQIPDSDLYFLWHFLHSNRLMGRAGKVVGGVLVVFPVVRSMCFLDRQWASKELLNGVL
jgi:hypothetical protein